MPRSPRPSHSRTAASAADAHQMPDYKRGWTFDGPCSCASCLVPVAIWECDYCGGATMIAKYASTPARDAAFADHRKSCN